MTNLISIRSQRSPGSNKLPQGRNYIQMNQTHHPDIFLRNQHMNGCIGQPGKKTNPYQNFQRPNDQIQLQTTPAVQIPPEVQQGDLFQFVFRHISAAIVGAGSYKATDFTDEAVLRASVDKLTGVKAFKNHNIKVDEEVGFVGTAFWDPRTTDQNGMDIPPGINAPFVIDRILQPEIVRKLNSQRPLIDSASVTVFFVWEPSHEFEFTGDFFWHLGEMIDGEMVRRVVTEIVWYEESSLVAFGADPFAKINNEDGELESIDWPNVIEMSKSKPDPWLFLNSVVPKFSVLDCYDKEKFIHLEQKKFTKLSNADNLTDNNMEESLKKSILLFIANALEVTIDKVTSESIKQLTAIKTEDYQKLENASKQSDDLNAEIIRLKAELALSEETKKTAIAKYSELEVEVNASWKNKTDLDTETQQLVNYANELLKQSRDDVKKLYLKFAGEKKEDSVIKEIEDSNDLKFLEEKAKKYGLEAYNKFGAYCKKCKSTDFDFRRSTGDDLPDTLDQETKTQEFFNLADAAINL